MAVSHDPVASEEIRPLRRAEYDRLVALGVFEGEKIELLYGRLVTVSPQREPHAFSMMRLTRLLVRALGDRAEVRVQLPFAATDVSEPEPDFAIVAPGDYLDGHPSRALLVIEVAESTLERDRRVKAPLYASAGIPEYWIVNLVDDLVEVHRDPRGEAYLTVTHHGREAIIAVPGFDGAQVPVREILPPR